MAEQNKLRFKKGDNVVVITGKDAGSKGRIIDVDTKKSRVFVDKVNLASRHTKPTPGAPQGGIVKKEASIDSSNVMLWCDSCGQGVRTRVQFNEDGSKSRVCVKCGAKLDK